MRQRVTVLGSTGSVGANTLDVIARHPERFEVFALSAASQIDLMLQQCAQFRPRFAVMATDGPGRELAHKAKAAGLATEVGPLVLIVLGLTLVAGALYRTQPREAGASLAPTR